MKNPEREREFMGPFFDFIGVAETSFPGFDRHKAEFPLLCSCMACHGIRDVYMGNEPDSLKAMNVEQRKELAHQIALVQHGYYMAKWESNNVMNKYIFPKKCSCECDHDWKELESPGHMLHSYECVKCTTKRTVDSSG